MKKFNYYILILPLIIVTLFILPDNLKSDDFSTFDNSFKNKYGLKASDDLIELNTSLEAAVIISQIDKVT